MSTLTSLINEKASQIGERADGLTQETAGTLHAAASSVRAGAATAANSLDEAGKYIESHNLKAAIGKSRLLVRKYPAELVAIAALVGFLSGVAFVRFTHVCKT
jgi:ElaB/YqjD/DUF883 family membrane-anchored ribosome-binding protein